jgi:hypothetical protein
VYSRTPTVYPVPLYSGPIRARPGLQLFLCSFCTASVPFVIYFCFTGSITRYQARPCLNRQVTVPQQTNIKQGRDSILHDRTHTVPRAHLLWRTHRAKSPRIPARVFIFLCNLEVYDIFFRTILWYLTHIIILLCVPTNKITLEKTVNKSTHLQDTWYCLILSSNT